MIEEILKKLKVELNILFKDERTGHDISHLERVLDNALEIQRTEDGDLYIVAVSALVHDVHRLMSTKLKKYVAPEDSLEEVRTLLLACDVDLSKLDAILEVVKNHDNKENKNVSLEILIIQDADALDAIGEIGIQRTLKYCRTHNIPITAESPLDSKEYIPDINPISTCHYIYRTMIPNAKNLYTKTAKEIAKDKIKVLESFVNANYKVKR